MPSHAVSRWPWIALVIVVAIVAWFAGQTHGMHLGRQQAAAQTGTAGLDRSFRSAEGATIPITEISRPSQATATAHIYLLGGDGIDGGTVVYRLADGQVVIARVSGERAVTVSAIRPH